MSAEVWLAATALVASWPPLTAQQNTEITTLAVAHQRRVRREQEAA